MADFLELLKQRSFPGVLRPSAKVPTAAFVLQARKRDDSGPGRVGFTVSRKSWNRGRAQSVRRSSKKS
jgi:ribonuclease P protein component